MKAYRHITLVKGLLIVGLIASAQPSESAPKVHRYSVIIRNGTIYDGSGAAPFVADLAIDGDHIAAIGKRLKGEARVEIDATGKAVSPGFINMLAHPEESLLIDGRAQSDLRQGVTTEVMGELSMGPLSPEMRVLMKQRQSDAKYDVNWSTLGEYLDRLEQRRISVNVASFVSAAAVRQFVLGERDVQPTAAQLVQMRSLVHRSMQEGAVGLTTMLIYSPAGYAKTPELIALASEAARCGGIYSAHIRSEGDHIDDALQETIDIAKASGAPAHIYHLKVAGRDNWGKVGDVIAKIEKARRDGVNLTADMYSYTAGASGFDVYMPPWVQDGGLEKWIERLKDPAIRARVVSEMRDPRPQWENLGIKAGGDGMLLLGFKNPALKRYTGRTLADVAKERGKSIEDTAIDLVIEDGSRVQVAFFLMSEDNVRRQITLPWVSFGSDEEAPALEGPFLQHINHPRAFGNFARVFAKYGREDHLFSVQEIVRKMTSLAADTLFLSDRGRLKAGYKADVVIFDPKTIKDNGTYEHPQAYATGVSYVFVNGQMALSKGQPTDQRPGKIIRGRAYVAPSSRSGGCRARADQWSW